MTCLVSKICADLLNYAALLPASFENGQIGHTSLSRSELRARIVAMEAAANEYKKTGHLQTLELDEHFPLRHIFAPGAYAREMTIKAGNWAIGKIHKHAHLSFITKGCIAVLTEDGPTVIKAPYTFVNSPGTKRVVLALEDTIWTTVHITEKTDLLEIEEEVIAKTFDDLMIVDVDQKGEIS